MDTFASKLKRLRRSACISQAQLASVINRSQVYISLIESDAIRPTKKQERCLLRALTILDKARAESNRAMDRVLSAVLDELRQKYTVAEAPESEDRKTAADTIK
jgi:predicted transcriptional regulator